MLRLPARNDLRLHSGLDNERNPSRPSVISNFITGPQTSDNLENTRGAPGTTLPSGKYAEVRNIRQRSGEYDDGPGNPPTVTTYHMLYTRLTSGSSTRYTGGCHSGLPDSAPSSHSSPETRYRQHVRTRCASAREGREVRDRNTKLENEVADLTARLSAFESQWIGDAESDLQERELVSERERVAQRKFSETELENAGFRGQLAVLERVKNGRHGPVHGGPRRRGK